jgi:hypothetical protein
LSKITGDSLCGGIAGVNEGSITNCYFLKDTEINVQLAGLGRTKKINCVNHYAINTYGFKNKATFKMVGF